LRIDGADEKGGGFCNGFRQKERAEGEGRRGVRTFTGDLRGGRVMKTGNWEQKCVFWFGTSLLLRFPEKVVCDFQKGIEGRRDCNGSRKIHCLWQGGRGTMKSG